MNITDVIKALGNDHYYELLQEARRITNLSEAEALRKKFMELHNQGDPARGLFWWSKAWSAFVADFGFMQQGHRIWHLSRRPYDPPPQQPSPATGEPRLNH